MFNPCNHVVYTSSFFPCHTAFWALVLLGYLFTDACRPVEVENVRRRVPG